MAHTGYGLFESWGMAGYSGVAPLIGGFFGMCVYFLGLGVVVLLADSASSVGAMTVSIFGVLMILLGPVLVFSLYLFDLIG
jgi:hypothetical protein